MLIKIACWCVARWSVFHCYAERTPFIELYGFCYEFLAISSATVCDHITSHLPSSLLTLQIDFSCKFKIDRPVHTKVLNYKFSCTCINRKYIEMQLPPIWGRHCWKICDKTHEILVITCLSKATCVKEWGFNTVQYVHCTHRG